MRGKSIIRPFLRRHAFNFRSISSSSSSRFPLNQNYLLSIPKKPFPVYTLQNLTLSRPFSDSPTGFYSPPLSEPKTPVPPNVVPVKSEEDFGTVLGKVEGESTSAVPKKRFPVHTPQNQPYFRSRSLEESLTEFYPPPLSEPEPPVPSNVVPVTTEEEFDAALSKAEGESLPAVLYFTATWCVPCRFIGPVMNELARRNPDVTTYKMDIEEEGLASKLKMLNITSVPTVHFFKEGKKEDEVVGGDVAHIVRTMKKLYNMKDVKKEDSCEEIRKDMKKYDSCEEMMKDLKEDDSFEEK
ncbi:hypothetical protein CRYUN_Cryun21dG0052100 [Craigia yunnanensis]